MFQLSQMARMASTNSRMRGAGCDHGMEKRLVMWGLIWLPRPRMKRPFEYCCRSQPMLAIVIGLRAKATAMDVPELDRARCARQPAAAAGTDRGSSPPSRCPSSPPPPGSGRPCCRPERSKPMPLSTFMGETVVGPAVCVWRCGAGLELAPPGVERSGPRTPAPSPPRSRAAADAGRSERSGLGLRSREDPPPGGQGGRAGRGAGPRSRGR